MILFKAFVNVAKGIFGPIARAVYLYSGLGFIVEMIYKTAKPEGLIGQKPSNFPLWAIGVYAGLYGAAATRYEHTLNRLYSRYGAFGEHVESGVNSQMIQAMIDLQREKVPVEPRFISPRSVIKSLNPQSDTSNALIDDISSIALQFLPQKKIVTISHAIVRQPLETVNFNSSSIDFTYSNFSNIQFEVQEPFSSPKDINLENCHIDLITIQSPFYSRSKKPADFRSFEDVILDVRLFLSSSKINTLRFKNSVLESNRSYEIDSLSILNLYSRHSQFGGAILKSSTYAPIFTQDLVLHNTDLSGELLYGNNIYLEEYSSIISPKMLIKSKKLQVKKSYIEAQTVQTDTLVARNATLENMTISYIVMDTMSVSLHNVTLVNRQNRDSVLCENIANNKAEIFSLQGRKVILQLKEMLIHQNKYDSIKKVRVRSELEKRRSEQQSDDLLKTLELNANDYR